MNDTMLLAYTFTVAIAYPNHRKLFDIPIHIELESNSLLFYTDECIVCALKQKQQQQMLCREIFCRPFSS